MTITTRQPALNNGADQADASSKCSAPTTQGVNELGDEALDKVSGGFASAEHGAIAASNSVSGNATGRRG